MNEFHKFELLLILVMTAIHNWQLISQSNATATSWQPLMQGSNHEPSAILSTLPSRLTTLTLLHDIMTDLGGQSDAKVPVQRRSILWSSKSTSYWPFFIFRRNKTFHNCRKRQYTNIDWAILVHPGTTRSGHTACDHGNSVTDQWGHGKFSRHSGRRGQLVWWMTNQQMCFSC